jgi:hypothetical protein
VAVVPQELDQFAIRRVLVLAGVAMPAFGEIPQAISEVSPAVRKILIGRSLEQRL